MTILQLNNLFNDTLTNINFNPSIGHLHGNYYILSIRNFKHNINKLDIDEPNIYNNPNHPWVNNWDNRNGYDNTHFFIIKQDSYGDFHKIKKMDLSLPVQDLRIFRFMEDKDHVYLFFTYNDLYYGSDLYIGNGDKCDDSCYLIGISYAIYDKNRMVLYHIPSEKPVCPNISNRVEKNWSLWTYKKDNVINLLISYALVPSHTAFNIDIQNIDKFKKTLLLNTNCGMFNIRNQNISFLDNLQEYYDNNIFISLSTPAYPIQETKKSVIYRGVGHLKIKHDFIMNNSQKKYEKMEKLKNHIKNDPNKVLHPRFIYMMFFYDFEVKEQLQDATYDTHGLKILDPDFQAKRHSINIISVSDAYLYNTNKHHYYLNFPAGLVINNNTTIVSYGNGDYYSQLLILDNKQVDTMMHKDIQRLKPKDFKFLIKEK